MRTDIFYSQYAEKLKQARKAAHLTQEYAAELLDISVRALQFFEAGVRIPRLDTALRMARLYGISLDSFIDMIELKGLDYKKLVKSHPRECNTPK